MSGEHAKGEIVIGDKPASSGRTLSRESGHKHKEESSSSNKTHRKGDKKKKMKKVVYYETDSSSPSTSSTFDSSVASKRHERKKYSKMPLHYPHISKRAPLLSVPLGKPPYLDGEDYCMALFVSASDSFWPPKAAVDCQTLSFSASFYKIRWGKNHPKST
jgi:hypothetical protein